MRSHAMPMDNHSFLWASAGKPSPKGLIFPLVLGRVCATWVKFRKNQIFLGDSVLCWATLSTRVTARNWWTGQLQQLWFPFWLSVCVLLSHPPFLHYDTYQHAHMCSQCFDTWGFLGSNYNRSTTTFIMPSLRTTGNSFFFSIYICKPDVHYYSFFFLFEHQRTL